MRHSVRLALVWWLSSSTALAGEGGPGSAASAAPAAAPAPMPSSETPATGPSAAPSQNPAAAPDARAPENPPAPPAETPARDPRAVDTAVPNAGRPTAQAAASDATKQENEDDAPPTPLESPVAVHGFASQGFIKTTKNNYLANSERGSFEFTEVGLNFTKELTERFRVGVQLFGRKLGPVGGYSAQFDWFYLGYRFADWLGL